MTVELTSEQHAAVELLTSARRYGIVTGGPGTGKTTTLREALDVLDARGSRYVLCAPTGKAAQRMCEATGRAALTIHRLLGYRPAAGWKHNRHNPLEALDLVVVDESSMIDIQLYAALMAALKPSTRIMFVGDADQLPPVGPGRPFADLVEGAADLVPMVRLTEVHRSAADSWICKNARRVLAGQACDLRNAHDFEWHSVRSAGDIMPVVRRIVLEHPNRFASADLAGNELQVLIPMRAGDAGIRAANKTLQATLNPAGGLAGDELEGMGAVDHASSDGNDNDDDDSSGEMIVNDVVYRLGDRVIQTRNNYNAADNLGVFNGEIGSVVSAGKAEIMVSFPPVSGRERVVGYKPDGVYDLEHAYALTIHRTQGSEFPHVLIVCHSSHARMLSRQLLYTAITRGKRSVIMVGDERGVAAAIKNDRPARRNTTFVEQVRDPQWWSRGGGSPLGIDSASGVAP